jgi:hypothetical protein
MENTMNRSLIQTTAFSLTAIAVVIGGCESMSPREEGTAVGAGVGAVAGAAVGSATAGTSGVVATRVLTEGCGEREPVSDNTTDAGRAKNRRVEILLREPAA